LHRYQQIIIFVLTFFGLKEHKKNLIDKILNVLKNDWLTFVNSYFLLFLKCENILNQQNKRLQWWQDFSQMKAFKV
jgi:hypothetical protein